jgi:hypothetical protein
MLQRLKKDSILIGTGHPVLIELAVKRGTGDAEPFGGLGQVTASLRQRCLDSPRAHSV